MKKVLLLIGAALATNLAYADIFIKNHTPYKVKLSYTYDKTVGDRGHVIESPVVEPYQEGKAVGDGLLTKTSYKINANVDTAYADSKDWPVVYSQTGVSDGWNREITIYTQTDENGNEIFNISNSVSL